MARKKNYRNYNKKKKYYEEEDYEPINWGYLYNNHFLETEEEKAERLAKLEEVKKRFRRFR